MSMNRFFIQVGSLLGAIGVMVGAFGAHALKDMLIKSGRFDTFETAVRYQFYHALAMVLVGILAKEFSSKTLKYSGYCFLAGVLIFSGIIYGLFYRNQNFRSNCPNWRLIISCSLVIAFLDSLEEMIPRLRSVNDSYLGFAR
jgi:uncharacterized membrane protein YgdD (TMEM256/DUF423 family)